RKVETFFEKRKLEKALSNEQLEIRNSLYKMLSDVLFVPDHKEPRLYHPRINAQKTNLYKTLAENERAAFDRIHEDFFYHRHNEFWYQQGMQKLPQLIRSTHMLVCGEDLGMIPTCVPRAMNELQILSLEIQRMPKGWTEFADPSEYPYHSVATLSTHDMSTLRGWWEEDPSSTQRYFNLMLAHQGIAPSEANGTLCEEIIRRQLTSRSVLCILSFQDWISINQDIRNPYIKKERINTPSNPKNYWRYRMHLTLEKLLKSTTLNNRIRELIHHSERNPQL
ncbi:MAG: 4-alpha-glucanotransferase, partial [Bacteroidaceae bacterium]